MKFIQNEETERCSIASSSNSDVLLKHPTSRKSSSSKSDIFIPYIDSSDEEGRSKHSSEVKSHAEGIDSGINHDRSQMPLKNDNVYSRSSDSKFPQNRGKSILLAQKSENDSLENGSAIKKGPMVSEIESGNEAQRLEESQSIQSKLRFQSQAPAKYTESRDQKLSTIQTEDDFDRKHNHNLKEGDKISDEIKKRSLVSQKSRSEEEGLLESILLSDDEDELGDATENIETQKGFWCVVGYISILYEYIVWNTIRIIASPKFDIIVLTLCSGLLLYIFDLLSDIVNGIMLLFKGKTNFIES